MRLKRFIAERQSNSILDLKFFPENQNSNYVEAFLSPNYFNKEIQFNFIAENSNNNNPFQISTVSEDFDYAGRYDTSDEKDNLVLKAFKNNTLTLIGQGTIKNGPIPPPYNKLLNKDIKPLHNIDETKDLELTKIDINWTTPNNIPLHIELKNSNAAKRWKFFMEQGLPKYSIEYYDYNNNRFYFIALHVEIDNTPGASTNIIADYTIDFPQVNDGLIIAVVNNVTLTNPGPNPINFQRKLFFKFENLF